MSNEIAEARTLEQEVFEALGRASMCWNPRPSDQVFDSTEAKKIGDELMCKIREASDALRFFKWMRKEAQWLAGAYFKHHFGTCDKIVVNEEYTEEQLYAIFLSLQQNKTTAV